MKPIWAQTLVKNEERYLWYAVNSVIDYVDRLLLWDTGSTDKTIQIAKEIERRYPRKVHFREVGEVDAEGFTKVRQEMLDATEADWILMLDGDEVWWQESIAKATEYIKNHGDNYESIVFPTINLVGDIFHYQEKAAGRYNLAGRRGHYNLRLVNRYIPGLNSLGAHGVWGWADGEGRMIQDRDANKIKFIDGPYLHATNLTRGTARTADREVIKRAKKFKYEIGENFPKDFYYPEVFFRNRPHFVPSPWERMDTNFLIRAAIETPFRKIKRRIWQGRVGY